MPEKGPPRPAKWRAPPQAHGPDHDKEFVVGLYLGDMQIAEGAGKSKQEAEQDAARVGLEKKGW